MIQIGYHASHEQFTPRDLLDCVQKAEQAGFHAAMCSDHFFPWSERQGQSGFAWSWLGAALQATSLSFGTVCAPGQRYHPAIIAQAAATLAQMYPQRFWVALGSGEYMNEHITGEGWPTKPERNTRLKESVEVMRALWAGETVTHYGMFIVEDAKLYTRPDQPPLVVGAALTEKTAEWMGSWVDAIITTSKPLEKQKPFIEAFRRGGGEGKPMFVQSKVSYDTSDKSALEGAHDQWRTNIFPPEAIAGVKTPKQFDLLSMYIRPEDMKEHVRISSDVKRHIDWIHEDIQLGFERVYLHNVNRKQAQFIEVFGEKVLPGIKA